MDSCRSRFGIGWLVACVLALLCVFAVLPQGEAHAANALARKALPESEPSLVTDTTKLNGTNWMSGVSGSLYLHEITIPGTHDAAMWNPFTTGELFAIQKAGYVYAKTQTLSIKEQLNAGIRLFDLRVTNSYPRSDKVGCYLVHGKVVSDVDWRYYGDMPGDKVLTLDDVLIWVQDFLRAHPTETIILDTSYESDSGYKDSSLVQAATRLQRYGSEINPSTNKTYMHYQDGYFITQMPTLSDVRGQFLVITTESDLRYGMFYPWGPGWAPTTIGGVPFARENHYEAMPADKMKYIGAIYNGGSVGKETFSNPKGGYKQQIPRSASQGVVGQGATVMTSSNRAPGGCDSPWASPKAVADDVNAYYYTLDYYQKHIGAWGEFNRKQKIDPTFVPGRLFGWVYSDFVTEQTSRTLWSTNFPPDLKHVNLTYQITNPATGKTDEKTTVLSEGSIVTLPQSLFGDAARDYELAGWEDASGKLIEGATYQLPAGQTGTVVLKARLALTWHGLQAKINAAKNNDTIVLDRNLTATGADVSLTIPAGKKLTIDLAGHTLNRNAWRTFDGGNVFQLRERSELVLMNGIVKGGDAPRGGGVLVQKNATFDAINVRIEGNRAEQRGGGVYVEANGIFKMYPQNGTLSFEPNVITNNKCRVGAGVYVEADGKLYFKGKVNVTGNKLSQWESAENNVYLAGTSTIELDQDINVESRIGVSVEKAPIAGKPAVISSGGGAAKTSVFSSDDKRYTVGLWQAPNYYDATALYSECTVTFDHADGQGTTTVRPVAYNTSATKPADPKRAGYDFAGWYSDKECTKPYDFTKPVTSNMTLYAKWNVAQHTVTFDTDNGQNPTTAPVAHGQAVGKPSDPTREGYTFAGWTVQKTILDSNWQPKQEWVAYRFSLPVTSDVTLKAQWKIKRPTVTFDANGGSFAGNPPTSTTTAQVDYGTAVARPTTVLTRDHAALMGWYTDQACTRAYDFSLPVKGDMTLYAGWQLDRREVRFTAFGGTPAPANQIVGYGERATKPQDPTRVGFAFKGWSTSENALVLYDFNAGVTAPVLELYAIWDVTVTFDTMDGKAPTTQTVQRGTMLNKPADPVREGFMFVGWYQDTRNRYVPYRFGAISVNEPMKLVARWVPKSYTVSFDAAGGTAVAAQTIGHGAKASQPNNPSKPGFTFTGWFTDAECTNAYDFNSPVAGNMTLHAGWKASEHAVTFNANGGSFDDGTTTKTYENIAHGSTLQSPPSDPAREGYIFCGWCTRTSSGDSLTYPGGEASYTYTPYDLSTPVTSDLGLYAKWERDPGEVCLVVFVGNGGAFGDGSTELVQTAPSGTSASGVKPADPTRAGYGFAGWCTADGAAFDFANTSVTSDLILYAKWTPIECTVTFDANGGSFPSGTEPQSVNVVRGSTLQNLPGGPAREGYVFNGWCTRTGSEGSYVYAPYNFGDPVTENLTLYAKWEVMRYDVVFIGNGGAFVNGDTERVQTVPSGTAAVTVKPADPTRAGYDFAGWCTADGAAFDFANTSVTSDLILYAKWDSSVYQVTFNANGGNFSGEETLVRNVDYGLPVDEPDDPKRENHVFVGWFTDLACMQAYDFDDPVTSSFPLYAKWEPQPHCVTFVFDDDVTAPRTQVVLHGNAVTQPDTPERAGYDFIGWHTTNGDSYTFELPVEHDLVLQAGWRVKNYTVKFDTQGADTSKPDDQSLSYGQTVVEPDDPTKANHSFQGWFADLDTNLTADEIAKVEALIDEDPESEAYLWLDGAGADATLRVLYDFEEPVKGDLTLHARWAADQHQVTFVHNDGDSTTTTATVNHNSLVTAPSDIDNTEQRLFAGWYRDEACTRPFSLSQPITGDITLYAKWVPKLYNVTFVTCGGSEIQPLAVASGTIAKPPANPTKDGCRFIGWYTSDSYADNERFDLSTKAITGDTVLYAKWDPLPHTVHFNAEGGQPVPSNQVVQDGEMATKPSDPSYEQHDFVGWFADSATNLSDEEVAAIKAELEKDPTLGEAFWLEGNALRVRCDFDDPVYTDLSLHARWEQTKHTVTFMYDGNEVSAISVPDGQVVPSEGIPWQLGDGEGTQTFTGWFADEALTSAYDFNTPVKSDLTLYGRWTNNAYTVTFNSEGGSEVNPKSMSVAYGEQISEPAKPTKYGCTFEGWYENTGETATQAELDASIDEFISGLVAAAETDEEKAAVEQYRQELNDRIWVNNGTVFIRYDFEGDAIYENTDLHARWNEGALTTEVVLGEGAPQVTAPNLRDVALKEVTGDEIAQNVHVWLQVEAPSQSSVAQKDRDALAATLGNLGCTSGLWLDLSLSKRVGGEAGSVQALHETQEPLRLSVEMPAALRSSSADVVRTFYLLRVHDGEVTTIAEGTGPTLEGTTDRFSTYLIAYKDSAAGAAGSTTQSTTPKTQSQQKAPLPVTGDTISLCLIIALGLLGAAAVAIAIRKKRNN